MYRTVDPKDVLHRWNGPLLASLVNALNEAGIVSDEDGLGISSVMVKRWTSGCDEILREHGYKGGPVSTYGAFFPGHGAIYCLYDSVLMDHDVAARYLVSVSERSTLQNEGNIGPNHA